MGSIKLRVPLVSRCMVSQNTKQRWRNCNQPLPWSRMVGSQIWPNAIIGWYDWGSLNIIGLDSTDFNGSDWILLNIIEYLKISLNTVGYGYINSIGSDTTIGYHWLIDTPMVNVGCPAVKTLGIYGNALSDQPLMVRCVQNLPIMRQKDLRSQLVANDGWQWVSFWLNAMKHNSVHDTSIPLGVCVSLKQTPTRLPEVASLCPMDFPLHFCLDFRCSPIWVFPCKSALVTAAAAQTYMAQPPRGRWATGQ